MLGQIRAINQLGVLKNVKNWIQKKLDVFVSRLLALRIMMVQTAICLGQKYFVLNMVIGVRSGSHITILYENNHDQKFMKQLQNVYS